MKRVFDKFLEEHEGDFSGLLSASSSDGVVFQLANGFRNRAEKLPIDENTIFGVASVTKLFTGLAVCKLIEEGDLSLEDKLCDIVKFDLGQVDKNITIFQLLTHTHGAGEYFNRELHNKYPTQLWENLDYYLQLITPLPPKFAPKERYDYSNSGYT